MLRLALLDPDRPFESGTVPTLRARYHNDGCEPMALTFWWNRTLRVRSEQGALFAPGPGPELPCGVPEEWTLLAPGESVERDEPLACTQPAGVSARVGWSYALPPGVWRVTLLYEAPPAHGFTQSSTHTNAFVGKVESNEVLLRVSKAPGLLERLSRRFRG